MYLDIYLQVMYGMQRVTEFSMGAGKCKNREKSGRDGELNRINDHWILQTGVLKGKKKNGKIQRRCRRKAERVSKGKRNMGAKRALAHEKASSELKQIKNQAGHQAIAEDSYQRDK